MATKSPKLQHGGQESRICLKDLLHLCPKSDSVHEMCTKLENVKEIHDSSPAMCSFYHDQGCDSTALYSISR